MHTPADALLDVGAVRQGARRAPQRGHPGYWSLPRRSRLRTLARERYRTHLRWEQGFCHWSAAHRRTESLERCREAAATQQTDPRARRELPPQRGREGKTRTPVETVGARSGAKGWREESPRGAARTKAPRAQPG